MEQEAERGKRYQEQDLSSSQFVINFVQGLPGLFVGYPVWICGGRHLGQGIGRNNVELQLATKALREREKVRVCVLARTRESEVLNAESQIILILPFSTVKTGFWGSYFGLFCHSIHVQGCCTVISRAQGCCKLLFNLQR